MKLKPIILPVFIGIFAIACSSEHSKDANTHDDAAAQTEEGHPHEETRTGTGPGTGTGSLSGENTAEAGDTHPGESKAADTTMSSADRFIATGTGTTTEVKKKDTLRGKWPSQANPYY
jgi:hypothetical protein